MANDSSGNASDGGNRSVLQNGVRVLSQIALSLSKAFPQTTGVAATASAGAATLPANPVGFITIILPDGTTALIAYYGA